ncbi:Rho guanine nucleotide exchange factor 10 [Pseudolycoriella hygida]|uniref:Rho guanine nucleotide exchange factor 10 n=1 Tax=Pseudolycoriella hygida TaxID=35572 RepID=A0A9Q0MN28_9DIPT|nr:Rho guanine nucleotide exchange factor 10 [Pseudolycoriella hygida]
MGGRRSYHQQNQPKYRNKGNNGAALFLEFPPPPNYPPSNDRINEGKADKNMHRCPNDLDRIEICLEPEQMLSSSPTEPYDKRSGSVGGHNGIGKFHNNVELQNPRYHNISATMERFEPSTSSQRPKNQYYEQSGSRVLTNYDRSIEISHNIPLLDRITAGPSYRTPTPNSMHSLTMNRYNSGASGRYASRHMYTTRYGTQENIYEDIEAEHRLAMMNGGQSMISLPQSMVEEEFRRVENRHRRVLAELNLSTEAMLMPSTPPSQSLPEEQCANSDHLSELLQSVELTDDLLSPVSGSVAGTGDMDSGFSGSSSGASCIGSIRYRNGLTIPAKSPTPIEPCNSSIYSENYRLNVDASFLTYSSRSKLTFPCDTLSAESPKNKNSFWSRKRWRKLPGLLGSASQKSSFGNDQHKLNAGVWEELPNPSTAKFNSKTNDRRQTDSQNPFTALDQEVNKNLNNNHLSSKHKSPNQKYNNTNCRRLDHNSSTRTHSSEDSYWSERAASDNDLSSDGEDESDRSVTSVSIRNSNLRSTLNKAKHHLSFDKWRGSNSSQSSISGNISMQSQADVTSPGESPGGRLSRWFSMRRGSAHHYDVGGSRTVTNVEKENKLPTANKASNTNCNNTAIQMPQLTETEEDSNIFGREVIAERSNGTGALLSMRRAGPCLITPTLPPTPAGLSHQQLKRRHIVAAIIHSENSYVATLQRLVNDYKKPLENSNPPILSCSKISTLFHRLPEILQCHTLFRIALADCVRNWDRDECIGDVFVGSFSKPIVLNIYSGFINNFSSAMELAKMEAKRKSALADFFKVKQISAHDRLSFFGLMDLLKYTPQEHHDRMSLQLALTQLESLAEMLNERKREAEQYQAFKEMLGNISGTFNSRSLSSTGNRNRYLLREDNLTQIEFNHSGFIVKSKPRRLLLLNDKVICVSVAPKQSQDFGATEKLTFKWIYPVQDVDIVDSTTSTSLSRILTAGLNRGGSIKSNNSNTGTNETSTAINGADNLCSEMSNLMHDYEVMSRINDLVGLLKCPYKDLSTHTMKQLLNSIQSSIQKKDEEMAWVDSCCLQLVARNKNGKEETFTFQTENPSIKKEWITELRLAQLALDANNSPAWEQPEHEQRPSTKMPLFVEAQTVAPNVHHQTEVRCGCFYTTTRQAIGHRRSRNQNYLWVCTSNRTISHITILLQNQQRAGKLKEICSFDLADTKVTSIEYVKYEVNGNHLIDRDTIWMGTDDGHLFIYDANNPEQERQVASSTTVAAITHILCHLDNVFVSLSNGSIQIFRRDLDDEWNLRTSQTVLLNDTASVSHILPINENVYAACGTKVWVINGLSGHIQKSFDVHHTSGECDLAKHLNIFRT